MTKQETVAKIIGDLPRRPQGRGIGWAPVNIALCKYWGKRDEELNLPLTSSLSISLNPLGAQTKIEIVDGASDVFVLNGEECGVDNPAHRRVMDYLDLFRAENEARYRVESTSAVPVAAGLASSAAGFAALALAVDDLYQWNLDRASLSILARLGSGSASRSVCNGFVEWSAGVRDDGMDSFAQRIDVDWPEFRIGLLEISDQPKPISSRAGMARTVATSVLFNSWPARVEVDMEMLKSGIATRDFEQVGAVAEGNALAMHATMLDSRPSILYWQPETVAAIHKVWDIRRQGRPLFLTMDAGPNIKLIFLSDDAQAIKDSFPNLRVLAPFDR